MSKVLIVGYGNVGKNLAREIGKLQPDIYDKFKTESNTKVEGKQYDVAFICVDTPYTETSVCDMSAVEDALRENDAKIYVIKSTVLPRSTERFAKETGKRIVFSPEYYGTTQHCNNFDFQFTILGGAKEDCTAVIQILQDVYDARHSFRITDSTTAELAKYMENSYLATKVSFCNAFWEICQREGLSYEELRELFILDVRVNPAHTFVYAEHPYWSSHCLNKDVPAVAEYYDNFFLKNVIEYNKQNKENY